MKFPWFWRWSKRLGDDTPVQPTPTQAPPETKASTVDLTRTRRMFYRAVNACQDTPCPRCGEMLSPETGVYVIATRRGRQQGDRFMISGDFGFYCGACPTVVIDPEQLIDLLQVGATRWDVGDAYTVLGLMALEAIPEDQRDVPIHALDAIPLVPFEPGVKPRRSSNPRRRKEKSKRKKRR